jgi:hypothetical protein
MRLKPFIRYYGSKWRMAHLYPPPRHGLIIEPFAGAAGYALNYADRDVLLIDVSPRIAELWRWLIAATPADVRSIPLVDSVDDLPADMPHEIATWFFDPTYIDQGRHYPHHLQAFEYRRLGEFIRSRRGQVIACEQTGATWLPFRDLASVKAGPRSKRSAEAIWTNEESPWAA